MVTQLEESQAKEFLKRAEIRTMKKDLLSLREADSLKERDKIAKIKTLEEQKEEQAKKLAAKEQAVASAEKAKVETVLQKGATQEHMAEKDLKDYATEPERQQIFVLESQRVGFEKQVDEINKTKEPALALEKNAIMLGKDKLQQTLNPILAEVKKLEDQQKFLAEQAQGTADIEGKKKFESQRWDLDKSIQEQEKKRWEIEKQMQDATAKIAEHDKSAEQFVVQKNELQNKILGIDKSLREIYSGIIERVEGDRAKKAQEKVDAQSQAAKARAEQNASVQRQQWGSQKPVIDTLKQSNPSLEKKIEATAGMEAKDREKFLHDVQSWTETQAKAPAMPGGATTPTQPSSSVVQQAQQQAQEQSNQPK